MMIDHDRTLSVFGIDATKLSHGSNKTVVAVCEKCGKYRVVKMYAYRELCHPCSRIGKPNPHVGTVPTEETRKKMSRSKRGKNNPSYGKRHSSKTIMKMSELKRGENNPNYGKSPSEETKRKIAAAQSGKNSVHWKGGISFGNYCPKFNDVFKELVRDQYDRRCFLCGKPEDMNGRRLSVHHVSYDKDCLCNSQCEFVPLCDSCHSKTGYDRQWWEDVIMCYLHPIKIWMSDI